MMAGNRHSRGVKVVWSTQPNLHALGLGPLHLCPSPQSLGNHISIHRRDPVCQYCMNTFQQSYMYQHEVKFIERPQDTKYFMDDDKTCANTITLPKTSTLQFHAHQSLCLYQHRLELRVVSIVHHGSMTSTHTWMTSMLGSATPEQLENHALLQHQNRLWQSSVPFWEGLKPTFRLTTSSRQSESGF